MLDIKDLRKQDEMIADPQQQNDVDQRNQIMNLKSNKNGNNEST